MLEFLANADMRLEDLEAEELSFLDTADFRSLPEERQKIFKSMLPEDAKIRKVSTYRSDETGARQRLAFDDESSGTRALFDLIGPIMDSLENG